MIKQFFVGIMTIVAMTACTGHKSSAIDNQADDSYAKASQATTSVVVSSELQSMAKESAYQVDALPKKPIQSPSILPPGSQIERSHERVSMDQVKKDTSMWLHEGQVEKLWPIMGQVLEDLGYAILEQDQDMGVFYVWQRGEATSSKQEPDIYQIILRKHSDHDITIALRDELNRPLSKVKAAAMVQAIKAKML